LVERARQEADDRLRAIEEELQKERIANLTYQAEGRHYAKLIAQGYQHADAIVYAREDAQREVEQYRESSQTKRELETYKSRDEEAQRITQFVERKARLRQTYNLKPSEMDDALVELDATDPDWLDKAHLLLRAFEKKRDEEAATNSNRDLRNDMLVPGAGMTGAAEDRDWRRPPPNARPGTKEWGEYVDQRRKMEREEKLQQRQR
jgi:hypothetical protein